MTAQRGRLSMRAMPRAVAPSVALIALGALGVTAWVGATSQARADCVRTRIDVGIYQCAPEPEPAADAPPPEPPLAEGGFEARLQFVSFTPRLTTKQFTGSGTLAGTSTHADFAASGEELGVVRPRSYGGELSLGYARRYLYLGGLFGADGVRPDAQPSNPGLATLANPGAMSMLHAGLEVDAVLPLDRVRLRAGAAFGAYFLSMPMVGFELDTCGPRQHYCWRRASTTLGFVQPRLGLDVSVLPPESAVQLSLGGFAGFDVGEQAGVAFGLGISVHARHEGLAP